MYWQRCIQYNYLCISTLPVLQQSMGARHRVGIGMSHQSARLHKLAEPILVPEFIDPVFTKTSLKCLFSAIQNERFGLVFTKTGSIISGTGLLKFENTTSIFRMKKSNLELLPFLQDIHGMRYVTQLISSKFNEQNGRHVLKL
jgi:hypothetical protein